MHCMMAMASTINVSLAPVSAAGAVMIGTVCVAWLHSLYSLFNAMDIFNAAMGICIAGNSH